MDQILAVLNSIISSIVWAFVGVVLLLAGLWLFDRIHPVDFQTEIKSGNTAAGVLFGSVALGLALIVFAAIR